MSQQNDNRTTMRQTSTLTVEYAAELAAAIRAGVLPTPGVAATSVAKQLETHADSLLKELAAPAQPLETAGSQGVRLPGTVRGLLQVAAAGGRTGDLTMAIGRAFQIQNSQRRSQLIAVGSSFSICSLAAIGTLAVMLSNGPLIESQYQLQTGKPSQPSFSLATAFGPTPVTVGLFLLAALGFLILTILIVRSRRGLNRSLSRWITSEAHVAMTATDLPALDRQDIIRALLAGWCRTVPGDASTDGGLLEHALIASPPHQAVAIERAAGFHRRVVTQRESQPSTLIPVTGSLVAGVAVLLYGIALMRPLAQLFETLASAPAVTLWEAVR